MAKKYSAHQNGRSVHNSPINLPNVPLREILENFSHDPDILMSILAAKGEEDKLLAEELKLRTQKIKLEEKRMDLELMKDCKLSPIATTSPNSQAKPFPITTTVQSNTSITNLGQYTLSNYPRRYPASRDVSDSLNHKPILSPEDHYNNRAVNQQPTPSTPRANKDKYVTYGNLSTIKLKDVPAPNIPKRKMSHEHVMEAVRNKVMQNSQSKISNRMPSTNHNIQSRNMRSPPPYPQPSIGNKIINNNVPKLSTMQPKDQPGHYNFTGPFSAPVVDHKSSFMFPPLTSRNSDKPALASQYPPISHTRNTDSSNSSPDQTKHSISPQ